MVKLAATCWKGREKEGKHGKEVEPQALGLKETRDTTAIVSSRWSVQIIYTGKISYG